MHLNEAYFSFFVLIEIDIAVPNINRPFHPKIPIRALRSCFASFGNPDVFLILVCRVTYLRLFCMYGTHFYSGPIGMFCRIKFFYSKRRYMGLTLQYINPIEVLQYQYKGWKSRRYYIQIHHNSAMI